MNSCSIRGYLAEPAQLSSSWPRSGRNLWLGTPAERPPPLRLSTWASPDDPAYLAVRSYRFPAVYRRSCSRAPGTFREWAIMSTNWISIEIVKELLLDLINPIGENWKQMSKQKHLKFYYWICKLKAIEASDLKTFALMCLNVLKTEFRKSSFSTNKLSIETSNLVRSCLSKT